MVARAKAGMHKKDMLKDHGHVLGLRDINVEIKKGEITVIMGLSGSGKSTLIRHLNRLIDPTAGEVIVNGTDIMKLDRAQLLQLRRTQMSMVFQKFALLPHETVLKNTGMACSVRGEDRVKTDETARKWLARIGLAGAEQMYPHQLSGGMQQRVGLARALTSNSELMLMDEAYSALDPLIRSSMQDLLLELQKDLQKTVVFITHDLDEALKLADHLVILKDGEIVQQGEPQNILLNPADPYIEDFVSDINRARVLRVRSVMETTGTDDDGYEVLEGDENLEQAILRSGGAADKAFAVHSEGKRVGTLRMTDVLKALVPSAARNPTAF
ncbi:betaine/proline/choline family ABC transporter ATP-binding protein [Allomesorhizobium camelthorni]|uniref:Quaternary amine transport ATP-binding protein n=1 Tax=Allomesorhizobium camelthorni TaxID=475069 RepID=A0A6G4WNP5_9HYPH|nr:betaine/proline/choline family ABC transporter ATP-binding protein [Mesorhizobium camelthorni]NGO55823.1 betaine/proline/choline family ABC transporter ATP-binding protein [Mesorhizobium camelthorni]